MMSKTEKRRLEIAEAKAAKFDALASALIEIVKEDLEDIARQAAEEIADDLTISH